MEFQVQRAGLGASEWKTICRNTNENYVREIFLKQLQLYSIGRFRLVAPDGKVLAEEKAAPIFSRN